MSTLHKRERARRTSTSRWGRVQDAESRGIRKGKLYQLAQRHEGLIRKMGKVALVDLEMLDAIIEACPPAELKEPA
jgi:hypothetical protein